MKFISLLAWLTIPGITACDRSSPPVPATRAAAQRPPGHIDSLVSREVALQRFRRGERSVGALANAAPSRDALVRGFLRALETSDTTTLRRLVVSRGEFAWLYYPTASQGLPPYSLNPDLMWFMLVEQSNRGAVRALRELGGKPLLYAGYRCEGKSTKEGENTLWGPCLVRWRQTARDTAAARLFGPILERGGRYKFLSYANKL